MRTVSPRLLAPTLMALAWAHAAASETPPPAQQGPAVTIERNGGAQRFHVALDDLRLVGDAAQAPAVKSLAQTAVRQVKSVGISPDGRGKAHLEGIASLPELQGAAQRLVDARAAITTYAVLVPQGVPDCAAERHVLTRRLIMKADGRGPGLARSVGCTVVDEPMPGTFVLEANDSNLLAAATAADALRGQPGVSAVEPEVMAPVATAYTPNDRFFDYPTYNPSPYYPTIPLEVGQWPISGVSPRSMEISPVWDFYKGAGININVVDTDMDVRHPDLGAYPAGNIRNTLGYDFISPKPGGYYELPDSDTNKTHATTVAGIIAAKGDNGIGIAGVAYESHIFPVKLLGGFNDLRHQENVLGFNDTQFGESLVWGIRPVFSQNDIVHVSCNAWGPTGWTNLGGYNPLYSLPRLLSGIYEGRQGRGIIYVWASGNNHITNNFEATDTQARITNPIPDAERHPFDNAGYNGYLNRYTIPVGALNRGGRRTWYSEIGPNLHVCAGAGDGNYNPYQPTSPWSTKGAGNVPAWYPGGVITTDRQGSKGFNHGEWDRDNDDTTNGRITPGSTPDPVEDLEFWGYYWSNNAKPDQKYDNIDEAGVDGPLGVFINNGYWVPGMDLDHDGWPDAGEDRDIDAGLDLSEDLDNDGHFDVWGDIDPDRGAPYISEDRNDNGVLDPGEDLDNDGHLDWWEDLDFDGNFDALERDLNGNGLLDTGEYRGADRSRIGKARAFNQNLVPEPDLDGDSELDENEDIDGDGSWDNGEDLYRDRQLSRTENLNRDDNWDQYGEDDDRSMTWNGGDYTKMQINGGQYGGHYLSEIWPGYRVEDDTIGTSIAAAHVTGLVSLMLQARPQLTWRDVQHILALRARKPGFHNDSKWFHEPLNTYNLLPGRITPTSYAWWPWTWDTWVVNAAGLTHNQWYGFGAVQAPRAVFGGDGTGKDPLVNTNMADMPGAITWPLLPKEATPIEVSFTAGAPIPAPDIPAWRRLEVPLTVVADADFRIECVELVVDVMHSKRGELTFAVVSPSGTVGEVPQRPMDVISNLKTTFTFRQFWSEHPGTDATTIPGKTQGVWKIIVVDDQPQSDDGYLRSATLRIHGYRPYQAPTVTKADEKGAPVGATSTLNISGGNFARNAAQEVVVTTALWQDENPALPNPRTLPVDWSSDKRIGVSLPSDLIDPNYSPGTATLIIGNPALVIGQAVRNPPELYFESFRVDGEDRYAPNDVWESGADVRTFTNLSDGITRRLKVDPAKTYSLQVPYSRPPVVSPFPDYLLPASSAGRPITVTFTVTDPDIDPATRNSGRPLETVNVEVAALNRATLSSSTLTPDPLNVNGTGTYTLTFTVADAGIGIVKVNATDSAVTSTSSFRIGILTDAKAEGCGGGAGLALLGAPLGLWLLRRRRR